MASTRVSLALSFARQYTAFVISFVASVTLARLLTPEEIGTFSAIVAIAGLAHMLRDFGVGQYVVRVEILTEHEKRAAFTVTLAIAWFLAVTLALASGPLAVFYDNDTVGTIVLILASTFVLIPFGSVARAVLRRQMRFGAIYVITIGAAASNLVTSVTLAYLGWGSLSLAYGVLANIIVTVALTRVYAHADAPIVPTFKGLRHVVAFGSHVSLSNILGEASKAAPELIMGKTLGMAPVGFFNKARGTVELFNRLITEAISPVALPVLSRQHHDSGDVAKGFLLASSYLTAVSWPFFVFVGLLALPLLRLLFGDQWDAAATPLRILAVGAAVSSTIALASPVVLAIGRPQIITRVQLLVAPLRVLAILATAPYGLVPVAIAFSATAVGATVLLGDTLFRAIQVRPVDLLRATWRSGALAVLANLVPAYVALSSSFQSEPLFVVIPLAAGAASLSWLGGLFLVRHPIRQEIFRALAQLTELRARRVH